VDVSCRDQVIATLLQGVGERELVDQLGISLRA
jgi:hypothetical protein